MPEVEKITASGRSQMGKIAVFDSWNGKFCMPIVEHWRALGHEVFFNREWEDMEQADVTFFYQADNNAVGHAGFPRKGKLFVQCVDIEVWAGQADALDWSKVDGAIFMAQHIKDRVHIGDTPFKIIKPGIDTDKFTLKQWI
jgi:hypothetical protein